MKVSSEIERLTLTNKISATSEDQITNRRQMINQLNETRKKRLTEIEKELEEKEIQGCLNEEEIYVEGHSIEKPKSGKKGRILSNEPEIIRAPFDKYSGIGDIDKMAFDKKFKNYLNHKEEFLQKANKRQQAILEKRRRIQEGEVQLDQYFNEQDVLSNTGSDYQYKNAEDMCLAYEELVTGKKNRKGVQLFYGEKFEYAFRLLEFGTLTSLMENPQEALISKELLLEYLFNEPMIMMLYSINPYLVADEIAEFETEIPNMLYFEEFSSYLLTDREPTYFEYTEHNLNEARQIGRGLKCAEIVGKWIDETGIYEDLIDLFDSVDMLGNGKTERAVLVKKMTLEMEKKRLLDHEVIEIVNINKLVPLNRIIYEIEHEIGGSEIITKEEFTNYLDSYRRLPTPEKDKLVTKLIMAGKYESSYVYVVSQEVLEFLKEVFNEMEKFAQFFVKKEKFIERIVNNRKYQKLKSMLVRSEGNRYVQKETVEQTFMRIFNEADPYIDIEEIMDFFSNRGRPRVTEYHVYLLNLEKMLAKLEEEERLRLKKLEETGEEPSTSSDEEFEKEIKRKQKERKQNKLELIHQNAKYDHNKRFNVTIPVAFGFDKRDKQKKTSIREHKLKQMLEQKRKEEDESMIPLPIKEVPRHVKEPLYEKMMKDQERERQERLERFRFEIQNSMVPIPERLTKKLERGENQKYEKEAYSFVARPMPWYCEVNLLDRINKQKQERRERILEEILNRHHDNDLPEGVLRMLERHQEIDERRQKNRSVSTTSVGECTFNPKISEYIPNFKAIHERLNMDMEIAKENREIIHPDPFTFETREKKSKSHLHCVPVSQSQLLYSRQYVKDNKEVHIEPTLKYICLIEKRKEEKEAEEKKKQEDDDKNQIRKFRQQKFAPQVRKILKQNEHNLGQSRKEALEKIKHFQREEKKKAREYENKMIEIYTKVWNRPLLIEGNEFGENDIKNNAKLNDQEETHYNNRQTGQKYTNSKIDKRDINVDYEDKRRRDIEQPPGQYLIEQDSDRIHGHHEEYDHDGEDDDGFEDEYLSNNGIKTS